MGVDMRVFTCEWDREVDGGWGMGGVGVGGSMQTHSKQTAREMARIGSHVLLYVVFAVPCKTFHLSINHTLLRLAV